MSKVDNSGKERDGHAELVAHAALHYAMNRAVYAKISQSACMFSLDTRLTSMFGVLRFVSIFSRLEARKLGPFAEGLKCGSNSAFVVAADTDQRRFLQTYFEEEELPGADLKAKSRSRPLWYSVVDGSYGHQRISLLMDTKASWKDFRWRVTVVSSGLLVEP